MFLGRKDGDSLVAHVGVGLKLDFIFKRDMFMITALILPFFKFPDFLQFSLLIVTLNIFEVFHYASILAFIYWASC